MAAAKTTRGDIYAAFGDSRAEALDKLGDLMPDDDEFDSLMVGSDVDVRQHVRDLAAELDDGDKGP